MKKKKEVLWFLHCGKKLYLKNTRLLITRYGTKNQRKKRMLCTLIFLEEKKNEVGLPHKKW